MNHLKSLAAATVLSLAGAQSASAIVVHNADVTPNVILGSGVTNGAWTLDRNANGVELGLRAKVRFDATNQPRNIFNYEGNLGDTGVYKFADGTPGGQGYGFAANSPSTASWNFEWSINTDFDDSSGINLDGYTYQIGLDFDPGPGTNYLVFDPINSIEPGAGTACWDHSFGDNTTAESGGTEVGGCRSADAPTAAAALAAYQTRVGSDSVAQNSWNMEFFDDAGMGFSFNGAQPGVYDFYLAAFDGMNEVARTTISVHVPAPASLALLGLGLVGVGLRRRRIA